MSISDYIGLLISSQDNIYWVECYCWCRFLNFQLYMNYINELKKDVFKICCRYNFDCIHRIESNTFATYLNILQNKDNMKFIDLYYVICFSVIINISEQILIDSFVSRFTGKRLRQYVYLQVLITYDPVSQGKVCNVFV